METRTKRKRQAGRKERNGREWACLLVDRDGLPLDSLPLAFGQTCRQRVLSDEEYWMLLHPPLQCVVRAEASAIEEQLLRGARPGRSSGRIGRLIQISPLGSARNLCLLILFAGLQTRTSPLSRCDISTLTIGSRLFSSVCSRYRKA